MGLTLHYHPLSSCCHKVLVALYELALPFEPRLLDLGDPAAREAHRRRWPTGKMPLLEDDGQVVPETSIIIEHLARKHGGSAQMLLPAEPEASLEVRLWDRLFDLYVMRPMQDIVADRLRAQPDRDPLAVQHAEGILTMAYGMIDMRMAGHTWCCGDAFTLADCAAAPSLFYAATLVPLPNDCVNLGAYHERLMQRPSVARVLEEATPFFRYYPGREGLPEPYRSAAFA